MRPFPEAGAISVVPAEVIGGMRVARLNRLETAELTVRAAIERRGSDKPCLLFSTLNGQGISMCAAQPEVREVFQEIDLISADGMSVVFASRLFAKPGLPERVATTDAFHDAASVAEREGASFYILGAKPAVIDKAVARARVLYPRLRIAGYEHGYFTEEQEADVVDRINAARPDVLWVGLGVPVQQQFLVRNRHRLTQVGVAKTCGGLFDFLSGESNRAPGWMQTAGLEWCYRMLRDPRRLGPRYLVTNPHAMFLMATRSGGDAKPFVIA